MIFDDISGEETDSTVGRVTEDREETVHAAFDKAEPRKDVNATLSITAMDKGRPPRTQVVTCS